MFILSAVGPDRPGMAHAVARVLFESGCNIEDTTMTRLSGQFAQILAIEPPEGLDRATLEARLAPLSDSHGLSIQLAWARAEAQDQNELEAWMLTAYGAEKTGLLANLTGALAQRDINLTDVQTRLASNGAVYVMLLQIELEPGTDACALRDELSALGDGLKLSLHPIDEDAL